MSPKNKSKKSKIKLEIGFLINGTHEELEKSVRISFSYKDLLKQVKRLTKGELLHLLLTSRGWEKR